MCIAGKLTGYPTVRILASVVVALKMIYGAGIGGEPAHPADQYRSLIAECESRDADITGPPTSTLMEEMPSFAEWRQRVITLVVGPLPRGRIPYFSR